MMKSILLILISCILVIFNTALFSQAPDTIWIKTFGGIEYDEGSSVQRTLDGGYIVVGVTRSFGAGESDVWLIKTDANGDSLWTKTYGGVGSEVGISVQETSDNGFIIAAHTASVENNSNLWLIKTNANGDSIWSKLISGLKINSAFTVKQTADGGYNIFGPGDDLWLIRTNSDGDTLFTKTFYDSLANQLSSVQPTSDGGFICAGKNWIVKTD
jgi:hypothetical protein